MDGVKQDTREMKLTEESTKDRSSWKGWIFCGDPNEKTREKEKN